MSVIKSLIILVLTVPSLVLAQEQIVLPNAGLTPESPFYFLDKLGEALQEFFTFNPEGKAKLQITFAGERIAEIKVILEKKELEVKGLNVAQSRLQGHIAKVAGIIESQKAEGEDVKVLAQDLSFELETKKQALEQVFDEKEHALEAQEKDLKAKLRQARLAGDTAQVETLAKQLGEIKAQLELLELGEEELEDSLEKEEERIEEEMEAKAAATKAIAEAEKERQEVLGEAQEDGIEVPTAAFAKFNQSLAQAKDLFGRGNFQGAKQLAKQAEKSLDKVEEAVEELEEAKEKEEELKEEQEEKEREAKEEQEEEAREKAEKEAERLEDEQEKARAEARKAEKRLREAGDNEDED